MRRLYELRRPSLAVVTPPLRALIFSRPPRSGLLLFFIFFSEACIVSAGASLACRCAQPHIDPNRHGFLNNKLCLGTAATGSSHDAVTGISRALCVLMRNCDCLPGLNPPHSPTDNGSLMTHRGSTSWCRMCPARRTSSTPRPATGPPTSAG